MRVPLPPGRATLTISEQKKAVLFAPFWRQENHVGCYRVGRFLRWLTEEGYAIVMIRAGRLDSHRKEPWGEEITVKDPLDFFPEPMPGSTHVSVRKPNKLRRSKTSVRANLPTQSTCH